MKSIISEISIHQRFPPTLRNFGFRIYVFPPRIRRRHSKLSSFIREISARFVQPAKYCGFDYFLTKKQIFPPFYRPLWLIKRRYYA